MMPISLHLDRFIATSPEILWQAWTTVEGLASWWWHTWPDVRYSVDARVGGQYSIRAADHGIAVRGEYIVLDAPRRLVFSWIWCDDEDGETIEGPPEDVEVTFDAEGSGTRVRVLHTGPWTTDEPAENYRQGWDFVLNALTSSQHDGGGTVH